MVKIEVQHKTVIKAGQPKVITPNPKAAGPHKWLT